VTSGSVQDSEPAALPQTEFQPLLKTVSRSFYLSLRFLPEGVREPLGLAYLLARTSDTIADASEAALGERLEALDRLLRALERANREDKTAEKDTDPTELLAASYQKLRCSKNEEAVLLQKADALVVCFAALSPALRSEVLLVMRTIVSGQRGDLIRFGYASAASPQALLKAADTVAYTYSVAGCVGEFWTRICALQTPGFSRLQVSELVDLGRLFGQGLQLVNILRDLPEDLRMGRCYLPLESLEAAGLSMADLVQHPARARAVFEHWHAQAAEWLQAGEGYVKGIRGWRLRFSVTLPRLLGMETLGLLQRHPPLETAHRLRVSKSVVWRCILKSCLS